MPAVKTITTASPEDIKKLNKKLIKNITVRFVAPVVLVAVVFAAIEVIGRKSANSNTK